MNLKNNTTLAGIIFLAIWIFVLILWGSSKDIKPDVSDRNMEMPSRQSGHPLWQDD